MRPVPWNNRTRATSARFSISEDSWANLCRAGSEVVPSALARSSAITACSSTVWRSSEGDCTKSVMGAISGNNAVSSPVYCSVRIAKAACGRERMLSRVAHIGRGWAQ